MLVIVSIFGRLDDEELVEEEAKTKLHQPTMESMLLRLEEIEVSTSIMIMLK